MTTTTTAKTFDVKNEGPRGYIFLEYTAPQIESMIDQLIREANPEWVAGRGVDHIMEYATDVTNGWHMFEFAPRRLTLHVREQEDSANAECAPNDQPVERPGQSMISRWWRAVLDFV